MGLMGLSDFVDALPSTPMGLDLAEEAINDVIKQIDHEQEQLAPAHFESAGRISDSSFGGADSAPMLALHYSRAHEVIAKTLSGIKDDLLAFQQACRDAKDEIIGADESSADRMRITQTAVEALEDGSQSREGLHNHHQAQQNQDVTGARDS
ncbi:hypothetical protein BH09ACT12_BH09ACT12_11780 [soil metagenome]